IDTNMKGPLGHGLSALLLGRSSISKQGIFVLPGVIDADYTGQICVMVYTLSPPVFIPKGQKIAQLVPFKGCVPAAASRDWGEGGFGSTGQALVNLTMDITKSQPQELVTLRNQQGEERQLSMLVDTGADVTIIA
ncbi:POK9 protein, partial [Tyrannus savana]|nr:POK9 protein [Tyrannus savana]